jgi:tRNA dimethylallyltransferase
VTTLHHHWFLTGPTASGKTAVGLELARTLNAEIVSLDSMAVYRGMDIGTAKPTAAERAAVPHHLIDLIEPHDDFSLAEYLRLAERVCAEISEREKRVLFVGGTPLYLKALLRGLFEGPPADWKLRHAWQELAEREGPTALHAELAKVDPLSAARLKPGDTRRLVRALEVFAITGESITTLQKQFEVSRPASECRVFVLDWPRSELVARIDARVEAMFAAGWVNEVRRLTSLQPAASRTAMQAVGYKEIASYLEGAINLEQTIELIQLRTRQFAKRQMTWFRSLSECRQVPMAEPLDAASKAAEIQLKGVGIDD